MNPVVQGVYNNFELSSKTSPNLNKYATPVYMWCPYLVKDTVMFEKVQRRDSGLTLGQKRGKML